MSMAMSRASVAVRPTVGAARPVVAFRPRRAALTVVAAKGGEEGGKTFDSSCAGTLAKNANFAFLGTALGKANLFDTLSGPGPFTVFAPDDDCFGDAARAMKTTKIELMNLPTLGDILKMHVVSGTILTSDLTEGQELTTLNGQKIKVTLAGGAAVNGAKLNKTNVKASNGVIHSIKAVLLPK